MSWIESVQNTADWYAANINTYGNKSFECLLEHAGRVRADCSGFVSCCLRVAGIIKENETYGSSSYAETTGPCAEALRAAGFELYPYSFEAIRPFDIIAVSGHVEIFYHKYGRSGLSYAWGNNHNVSRGGLPCWMTKKKYKIIWRCMLE